MDIINYYYTGMLVDGAALSIMVDVDIERLLGGKVPYIKILDLQKLLGSGVVCSERPFRNLDTAVSEVRIGLFFS